MEPDPRSYVIDLTSPIVHWSGESEWGLSRTWCSFFSFSQLLWLIIVFRVFVCLFVWDFWCGPFLKSLLNLLQHCFCFVSLFWLFDWQAHEILSPCLEIQLPPCVLEEVLTTGPPGKSLAFSFDIFSNSQNPQIFTGITQRACWGTDCWACCCCC